MIDIRQCLVLDAIAQQGSLAGAGRALQWSQPTVAHHLASLERELGGLAVRRSAIGAQLTALGEMALQHCSRILDQAERLESDAREFIGAYARRLRLGVIPTVGAQLLPQTLLSLEDTFTVSVIEAENERLNDDVLKGSLDVAIVTSGPLLHEHGRKTMIGLDRLLLAVPADSPLAGRTEVRIAELPNERWILAKTRDDAADRALIYAAKEAGFEPLASKRTDNYATVIGYVRAGFGVALIPGLATAMISNGVATIPITPRIDRTFWAVGRPGLNATVETEVASAFQLALRQWNAAADYAQ